MGNNHLPTERDEISRSKAVEEGFQPLSRLEFFLRYKNGDQSGVNTSRSQSDKDSNDGWSHRSNMEDVLTPKRQSISSAVIQRQVGGRTEVTGLEQEPEPDDEIDVELVLRHEYDTDPSEVSDMVKDAIRDPDQEVRGGDGSFLVV